MPLIQDEILDFAYCFYFLFGLTRFHKSRPVRIWSFTRFIDDDVDHITILEAAVERRYASFTFAAVHVADVRVNGVRKIDAGTVFRKIDDIAFGRKDNTIAENIDL